MTNSNSKTASLEDQRQLLGQQLKGSREFRRHTLHTLAEDADVGVQTLVRIEKGDKGVGLLNLQSVAEVLGMRVEFVPREMPPAATPASFPLHVDQAEVVACVDAAVAAAIDQLELLGSTGERRTVPVATQRQLRSHMLALLAGRSGASAPAPALTPLVYCADDLGGPLRAPRGAKPAGWVLRMRHGSEVLQSDGSLVTLDEKSGPVDVWATRTEATIAFYEFIERAGHPPGPLDASPVYLNKDGTYRY